MAADVDVALSEERIHYLSRAKLIELLGADAAQRLVAAMGGAHFSVPPPDSQGCVALAATIGAKAAADFCYEYGDLRVVLPRFLRSMLEDRIVAMTRAGMSAAAIARELRCTERRVFQIRAQITSAK
jgi:hypothetical protein